MYVCHCNAVTDRTVDAAIASGATTVPEITERCTAGGGCGGVTACWRPCSRRPPWSGSRLLPQLPEHPGASTRTGTPTITLMATSTRGSACRVTRKSSNS